MCRLAQMVRLVREKGYTIPTCRSPRAGLPAKSADRWVLKVPSSGERIELVEEPQNPSAYAALARYTSQTATVRGKMTLPKNGRLAPLVVSDVK
jgi:hypothetical protein